MEFGAFPFSARWWWNAAALKDLEEAVPTHSAPREAKGVVLDHFLCRALAAAEFEAVVHLVATIAVHFRSQFGRLYQVGSHASESFDLVAHHVAPEALAVLTVGFEVCQYTQYGCRGEARRQALDRHSELFGRATQQHQIVRHFLLYAIRSIDLARVAVEAYIGDPMLAA